MIEKKTMKGFSIMADEMDLLNEKIASKKKELIEITENHRLTSDEVLQVSHELDKLVLEYQKKSL